MLTGKLVEDSLCCISVVTVPTAFEKWPSPGSDTLSSFFRTKEGHLLEHARFKLREYYINDQRVITLRTCSSLSIEDDNGKPSVDLAMSVKSAIVQIQIFLNFENNDKSKHNINKYTESVRVYFV